MKRYDIDGEEDSQGDWVRWDDVEARIAEIRLADRLSADARIEAEREACAKIADIASNYIASSARIADLIRARSKK